MKIVLLLTTMAMMGCASAGFGPQREYMLQLADKCSEVEVSEQRTKLTCPKAGAIK